MAVRQGQEASQAASLDSPKGLWNIAQGCRAQRLPWVANAEGSVNPNGVSPRRATRRNPFRVEYGGGLTPQGSGCAATLGYVTQALRASKAK
jgi:hypothetical protein